MGLLPIDMDLLPPSDDRISKLILTAPDSTLVLKDLIKAITGEKVSKIEGRNNEIPVEDIREKAERLDVNLPFYEQRT